MVSMKDGKLILDGVVDFDNAASVCEAGLKALASAGKEVVVDLGGLKSENSVTVAVIVQWARAAAKAGQKLSLASVPEQFRAIVKVSGLQGVLATETP